MNLRLRAATLQNCYFGYGTFGGRRELTRRFRSRNESFVTHGPTTQRMATGYATSWPTNDMMSLHLDWERCANLVPQSSTFTSQVLWPRSDNSESTALIPIRFTQQSAKESRLSQLSK